MGAGECTCGNGKSHTTQDLLCELFDPETSAERATEVRSTLAGCPHCVSRLESEQAVRHLVRDCCGNAHAPEPLRQRIIASITSVTYTEIRFR
ncbi:mycothiol system anti-sigma-R factor [Corynebacterium aquatimens]|uniref:mycothiol system anti-sigma-R factor n=1 Tax=Corynebacterium TaxID=1716 RepID=UPI001F2B79A0|nr:MULTISPECIES: mycothiol system anti-sigma-R factor [Corynebacterium]QYH20139.1 mycothiol system anti-sigma-R factor [Corynebacterium aquatimens]UIZ92631.1 mycothiol system anti-sigma-R factor [Corynebacterium sp. CNCTC7651]